MRERDKTEANSRIKHSLRMNQGPLAYVEYCKRERARRYRAGSSPHPDEALDGRCLGGWRRGGRRKHLQDRQHRDKTSLPGHD